MMKMLPGESWKKIMLPNCVSTRHYAVSNMGRVASYKNHLHEDARQLAKSTTGKSLPSIKILFESGSKKLYIHQLVAKYFLPEPPKGQDKIIHLDKDTLNNKATNLKWVTADGAAQHMASEKPGKLVELRLFVGEDYRLIDIPGLQKKYAITRYGRLISFINDIKQGVFLQLSVHKQGYKIWRFKQGNKHRHYLLHRLVAEYFLPEPAGENYNVVHLNHNLSDNRAENLAWLPLTEQRKFSVQSEASQQNAERLSQLSKLTGRGRKLTVGKVKLIKSIIRNPKRKTRLKMVARQFGISPMQLYRIQTGENWGWVKI
jgi:hypothetical protein